MHRFYSKALIEEAVEQCNGDAALQAISKMLNGHIVFRAFDDPDGKDITVRYEFDKGKCTHFDYQSDDAPSPDRDRKFSAPKDGVLRISSSYETFAKLDRGEMEPADAINSPDYKIDGNILMLLPLMKAINGWSDKLRNIPKTY